MRVLDIIQLNEFAQGNFVMPQIDVIGPTDPATASINKQNALTLLQLEPDSSAIAEVQKLLAQFQSSASDNELQPTDQAEPIADPNAPALPGPIAGATPAQATSQTSSDPNDEENNDSEDEEELDQFGNPISEGKKAQDIGARVANLDENNPEQAELLARIEAILESKKLGPVISSIVNSKFTHHLEQVIETFKNAMISVKVSIQEKVKFLATCKTGFFDMSSIKTSPVGNLYAGLDGVIFNAIRDPLFQIEFGTGGNKIGKGEALLAIIGKGAYKGEKGDIRLESGEEIEVKASNTNKKGTTGAVLVALGKGESEEGERSKESAYGSNTEAGKTFTKMIAKSYRVKPEEVPHSITSDAAKKFFNPFMSRGPARVAATKDALVSAYKIIFKKQAKNEAFFKGIDTAFDGGKLDVGQLTKVIRSMEFDYYKSVIKHDAILFINGSTGTYRYIESGDDLYQQLQTSSKNGANLYSTGVIDFTGSYGNGFGKIFTK
jgi:hypothetical protein